MVPALGEGEELETTFEMEEGERETLEMGIHIFLARKLLVPEVTISIAWTKETATDGMLRLTAAYVITISDSVIDAFNARIEDRHAHACFLCLEKCEDADEPGATRSREENCAICNPCSLCDRCRTVIVSRGRKCATCLVCLTPEERTELSWPQQRRIRLLDQLWRDEIEFLAR